MIYITNIGNAKKGAYDKTYAIVRSMKNKSEWIEQMAELSPSWDLFKTYLGLRDSGKWNAESFANIYVPTFLNEIKNNEKAKQLLNELYTRDKNGENICLVCFCKDETLCHRSIVAGLLKGAGANIKTDINNDYTRYYDMYKQNA